MFKRKLKTLAKALNISEDMAESFLIRQAGYLKKAGYDGMSSKALLESYNSILPDIIEKDKRIKEDALKDTLFTKNEMIFKYKEKIVNLYKKGFGCQKISNQLKLDHNVKVSRSAIDVFLKNNGVKRNG
jgi:hypothetical protein